VSQPVLFVIDDDAVHALRDDPTRQFGMDFRVIGESPAAAGLATLRELADGHEPVALLIVDHDIAKMPGVDFLARAYDMHPLAKPLLVVERDAPACSPVVRAKYDARPCCGGATRIQVMPVRVRKVAKTNERKPARGRS